MYPPAMEAVPRANPMIIVEVRRGAHVPGDQSGGGTPTDFSARHHSTAQTKLHRGSVVIIF